ncbi:dimethylamine monooxygenase subunit DmmA family protein [Hansschlegelia plantiphila]|uniref:dimethylamine monooxygenase subunit DmmA family protein n=1 Tax=Hansschlegelia plantiphila TaxID=374655 RepID=UPI003D1675C2
MTTLSDIKSRPIYAGLKVDDMARRHLVAAEGEGALAVIEAFSRAPDALDRTTILYCPAGSAAMGHDTALADLNPDVFHLAPSPQTLLVRLNVMLSTATMGTRLYATGTEGFIGAVIAAALPFGVDHHSIYTEHRGSLARRVQCVHCKGMTENVTATPFTCSHCGLTLFVRDHYSRRLGAFQGVCVDAEEPGVIPPVEELYK